MYSQSENETKCTNLFKSSSIDFVVRVLVVAVLEVGEDLGVARPFFEVLEEDGVYVFAYASFELTGFLLLRFGGFMVGIDD